MAEMCKTLARALELAEPTATPLRNGPRVCVSGSSAWLGIAWVIGTLISGPAAPLK